MKPTRRAVELAVESPSFASVIRAAHIGTAALVPPTGTLRSPMVTVNPFSRSAFAATSGTALPVGTWVFCCVAQACRADCCHAGREKVLLKPPPVPMWNFVSSQAVSLRGDTDTVVPPQPSTFGLHAGNGVVDEGSSPEDATMVMPSALAFANRVVSIAVTDF